MAKIAAKSSPSQINRINLDSWLLGADELDQDAVVLLTAYRAACESVRLSQQAGESPSAVLSTNEGEAVACEPTGFATRALPAVPRLRFVEGVECGCLASLHGQLLAGGYLTAEVLGRSDGLAYCITREGLRHLNGDTATAEAA